jgi:hypothetical protein
MSSGRESTLAVTPGIRTGTRRLAPVRPPSLDRAPDAPKELDPAWVRNTSVRILHMLDRLSTAAYDYSREFDQYQPNSSAALSGTLIELQASYESIERVESIIVTGPVGATLASELNVSGSVATPGAGAILCSTAVPAAGLYTIQWGVAVQTAPATVPDNIRLGYFLGAGLATAVQPLAIGGYQQNPVGPVYIPAGTTISVSAIGAEATATLYGEMVITPFEGNVPFALQLGSRYWNLALPPSGILVISPVAIRLDNSDLRQIISSVVGDWNLELMGHADINYRRP